MSQFPLTHSVIQNVLNQTADQIRSYMKKCMSFGMADLAGAYAVSLVRATRPDLDLILIEEPKVWINAEKETN